MHLYLLRLPCLPKSPWSRLLLPPSISSRLLWTFLAPCLFWSDPAPMILPQQSFCMSKLLLVAMTLFSIAVHCSPDTLLYYYRLETLSILLWLQKHHAYLSALQKPPWLTFLCSCPLYFLPESSSFPLVSLQLNVPGARWQQISGAMDLTSLPLLFPVERHAKRAGDEANYEDKVFARSLLPVFKQHPLQKKEMAKLEIHLYDTDWLWD